MALPIIKHPTYDFKIPTTGAALRFRPMLVPEERTLLTAKESGDPNDVRRAVYQVVEQCSVSGPLPPELKVIDLEWLFIQLRRVSVSNVIELAFDDAEDGLTHQVKLDLDAVQLPFDGAAPQTSKVTEVGGGVFVQITWPRASDFGRPAASFEERIAPLITRVFDSTQTYTNEDSDELQKWVAGLPIPAYVELQKWLDDVPSVTHQVSWVNSKGTKREVTLKGLSDFFELG